MDGMRSEGEGKALRGWTHKGVVMGGYEGAREARTDGRRDQFIELLLKLLSYFVLNRGVMYLMKWRRK